LRFCWLCCKEDQVNSKCCFFKTFATNLSVREEAEGGCNNFAEIQQENLNHTAVSKAFQ
jgi:hypothetical protein